MPESPKPLDVLISPEQAPVPVVVVAETPPGATPAAAGATVPGTAGTPVNVTVMAPAPPAALVTKKEGTTLAPTTTEQEDVVTAGQRRVNLIWETVQATLAISITFAIIYLAIVQTPAETITNAFFLIVGFYFSRTNHQAIGGEGKKPAETKYEGR